MIAVPGFEIDGQPRPELGEPKGTSAIKVQTTGSEQVRSSFELLVVLLNNLECYLRSASNAHGNGGFFFLPSSGF